MARFTFPTSASRTISQRSDAMFRHDRSHGSRTFLAVPLRQQGELIGALVARRTEVRPFTPAQIKLLGDLRRPGGDRHRECPVVQRAQGGVGAANRDE